MDTLARWVLIIASPIIGTQISHVYSFVIPSVFALFNRWLLGERIYWVHSLLRIPDISLRVVFECCPETCGLDCGSSWCKLVFSPTLLPS